MDPVYVQFGCGFSAGNDWLNFDSSPSLRIERLPFVGSFARRIGGNPRPFPDIVRYGDISRGLPLAANSVRGVYASHVLEHLALDDFRTALQNTFRMLEPGGVFRLIVPDLQERARRYIESVSKGSADASVTLMKTCCLGVERRPKSILGRLRLLLGASAHLWMWDEPSLVRELKDAGFTDIKRCDYGDAGDAMFSQVEDEGRFFDRTLDLRELALTARKPGVAPRAIVG